MTERHIPQRKSGIATRARLLEATRWCVAEYGRDRFTTEQVAERAGVAIGALYRYFENRAALLDEALPGAGLYYPLADVEHHHQWGCLVCGRTGEEHLRVP